jgi:hypothetical protein
MPTSAVQLDPSRAALAAARRLERALPGRAHRISDADPPEALAKICRDAYRAELIRRGAVSIVGPDGRVSYR